MAESIGPSWSACRGRSPELISIEPTDGCKQHRLIHPDSAWVKNRDECLILLLTLKEDIFAQTEPSERATKQTMPCHPNIARQAMFFVHLQRLLNVHERYFAPFDLDFRCCYPPDNQREACSSCKGVETPQELARAVSFGNKFAPFHPGHG